jgi:hypothetical protein
LCCMLTVARVHGSCGVCGSVVTCSSLVNPHVPTVAGRGFYTAPGMARGRPSNSR